MIFNAWPPDSLSELQVGDFRHVVRFGKELVTSERQEQGGSNLPAMLERLATDITKLFDQKFALLRLEVREDVNAYVRGSILVLSGGIVAAVGFALTNVALAFAVSILFADLDISPAAKYALGFIVTGVAYLLIGTIVILMTKNRLAKQALVPRTTLKELERDKEWIEKEL